MTVGIISAAGAVGGAAIASRAAGKAGKTQARAADRAANLQYRASQDALNFQREMWETTQAQQDPWLQAGQGAVTTLAHLTGIPMSGRAPAAAPRAAPAGGRARPAGAPVVGRAVPRMGDAPAPRTLRQLAQPPADVEMVMLRAPDGTEQAVPASLVDHYVAQGAQRISGGMQNTSGYQGRAA